MTTYYSTFTSGLQEVVRKALPQQLKAVTIDLLLDGLVVYTCDRPLPEIRGLRFFHNTFLLICLFDQLPEEPIPFMMKAVLKQPELARIPRWAVQGSAFFRLMASRENQTVAVERDLLNRLEKFFAYKLRLKIHRSKPDTEVWFLARREGYGLVGLRVTRSLAGEKALQKGELRSELANLLCLLSEPSPADLFLDPFAGSGAIAIERASAFPWRQIIASEADPVIVERLRQRVAKLKLKIAVEAWDVRRLEALADESVDKIVTDPPWGLYAPKSTGDLPGLYAGMLAEFSRVLKVGGLLVILSGQKELLEGLLGQSPSLQWIEKFDILVSGKKAAIYKIRKY